MADILILTIDGSYGLEMETFEALQVLKIHELPKIIIAVTHIDLYK